MNKLFFLREERHLQALLAFLAANWRAMAQAGKPLAVEIKPEKSKRSLDQNRLYWALLHQVEDQAWVEGRQYSSKVWHECAKRRFLGLVDLPGGGHMAISTATLSTKEFSEYVEEVSAWATTELGVQFVAAA